MTNGRRLLIVVNDARFFLSHRLPIAIAARDAGYEVHVATPADEADRQIREHGFWFHPIPLTRAGRNLVAELRLMLSIVRLMRSIRPDLAHLVTIKPVLYGSIAARLTGVKAVLAAVSGLGPAFSGRSGAKATAMRLAVEMLYRIAFSMERQKVVFQNSDDLSALTEITGLDPRKAILIRGSGVDLEQYSYVPEPRGEAVVFMASRLVEGKGADLFVEAARRLRSQGIVARFRLAGVPDLNSPTRVDAATVEQWCEEGAVEVLGHRTDIPWLLAGASIAVLPSSYREGLPKFLIEAAASGRPIVTTDHPGCRDAVIPNKSGLLIPVENVDRLVLAIARLLADPDLRRRMGREGRALAEREFDVRGVVKRHLEIYEDLLRPRGDA